MGKYSGQCDCVAKTFCKEHVFLMILSKWGSVRAAVRVLQKCNRLWPLSKCSAVKTTFRHKSDEKGENEKFCPKTFSFQAKYFRAGEERNSLIHENKKFWWSGWIVLMVLSEGGGLESTSPLLSWPAKTWMRLYYVSILITLLERLVWIFGLNWSSGSQSTEINQQISYISKVDEIVFLMPAALNSRKI